MCGIHDRWLEKCLDVSDATPPNTQLVVLIIISTIVIIFEAQHMH